jgi:hypothetical protein
MLKNRLSATWLVIFLRSCRKDKLGSRMKGNKNGALISAPFQIYH